VVYQTYDVLNCALILKIDYREIGTT